MPRLGIQPCSEAVRLAGWWLLLPMLDWRWALSVQRCRDSSCTRSVPVLSVLCTLLCRYLGLSQWTDPGLSLAGGGCRVKVGLAGVSEAAEEGAKGDAGWLALLARGDTAGDGSGCCCWKCTSCWLGMDCRWSPARARREEGWVGGRASGGSPTLWCWRGEVAGKCCCPAGCCRCC